MTPLLLDRRSLLGLSIGGVALAYAGRAATQSRGARPKLVVVIARGAMDGLSVTVPFDDPNYRALRGGLARPAPGESGGVLALGDGFGLHPALTGLKALHAAGQMRFAPAVATSDRGRSHFDAQDALENGGDGRRRLSDGWLNSSLVASGGGSKGLSIGVQTPLILRGPAATANWAPGGRIGSDDRIAMLLQDLYGVDPLLHDNLAQGLATEALVSRDDARLRPNDTEGLGRTVARLMAGDAGTDVVALSIDGWDTHTRQESQMLRRLTDLDRLIGGLREGLGEQWGDTVLMVATEFGRTARANGTLGTDHGTGSSVLLAGGALRRGGPIGDWPTLADSRLLEGRDLRPTLDARSIFKGVLRDHLGVDRAALDTVVFPGSAAEAPAIEGLV